MDNNEEFNNILADIVNNNTVQELKKFRQHYSTSRFAHCKNVAYFTYIYCKKHNLDYISATRAAMLHDLFLYDWRVKQTDRKGFHGFTHPRTALNNSMQLFELNDMEKDIILKHMWPLTIILPKYKESYVVTVADKYSAWIEFLNYLKNRKKYIIKEKE